MANGCLPRTKPIIVETFWYVFDIIYFQNIVEIRIEVRLVVSENLAARLARTNGSLANSISYTHNGRRTDAQITRWRGDVTTALRANQRNSRALISLNSADATSFGHTALISSGTFHVRRLFKEPVKPGLMPACSKDFVVRIDDFPLAFATCFLVDNTKDLDPFPHAERTL